MSTVDTVTRNSQLKLWSAPLTRGTGLYTCVTHKYLRKKQFSTVNRCDVFDTVVELGVFSLILERLVKIRQTDVTAHIYAEIEAISQTTVKWCLHTRHLSADESAVVWE